MRSNNKAYSWQQQPFLIMDKKKTEREQQDACYKKQRREIAVMMPAKPVIKGVNAYYKSQRYHASFKIGILDNIDAEQGKAGKKQGQQRTVNSAGQRSPDT